MAIQGHIVKQRGEEPFGAIWVFTAPWAHPLWDQYVLTLADLTTDVGWPPLVARPGMQYEMLLFAVDPEKRIDKWPERKPGWALQPGNYGYQFAAESDDAALARIQKIMDAIEIRELSPDTDWSSIWDRFFADGVSLKTNMFEQMGSTLQ